MYLAGVARLQWASADLGGASQQVFSSVVVLAKLLVLRTLARLLKDALALQDRLQDSAKSMAFSEVPSNDEVTPTSVKQSPCRLS